MEQLLQAAVEWEWFVGHDGMSLMIHMLIHLTRCILRHGPMPAYWLYPYERMNYFFQQLCHCPSKPEVNLARSCAVWGDVIHTLRMKPELKPVGSSFKILCSYVLSY